MKYTTWTSSLASYWGAVFGGIVSGVIALGGTFIMINYYRKSDIQNKVNENKPFINIMVNAHGSSLENKPILFELGHENHVMFIEITFKNIGKGFAQILVYYDGSTVGGNKFRHTLEQGMQLEKNYFIKLNYNQAKHTQMNFGIMFMDCFSNEYLQTFEITNDSESKVDISCNYPQLMLSSFT